MSPDLPPSSLRLHIDPDALVRNWRALDRLSGTARAGAAVKADGYGLGARGVVTALAAAGCGDFFVAHWSEAARLIDLVDPGSIAVLHGTIQAADAHYALARGLKPVINSLEQARRWLEVGGGRCDLMVDTGINRIGIAMADLGDPLIARLEVDVLMSHLASAEDESPLNEVQRKRWVEACQCVVHQRSSLANSAGIALGTAFHGDLTRPGLSLYGGVPCTALAQEIEPVVAPEAAIIQIRTVEPGESIGYNATFTAERRTRIGIVSLGYADGYLRCWSGKGRFRSNGKQLPVLGRVSMDMAAVDLTSASDLSEGDWIRAEYALPEAAAISGLSQYELLTLLGSRFPREA